MNFTCNTDIGLNLAQMGAFIVDDTETEMKAVASCWQFVFFILCQIEKRNLKQNTNCICLYRITHTMHKRCYFYYCCYCQLIEINLIPVVMKYKAQVAWSLRSRVRISLRALLFVSSCVCLCVCLLACVCCVGSSPFDEPITRLGGHTGCVCCGL